MDNIYLKKLLTVKGLGLVIIIILLYNINTYAKSYLLDYFMINELTQMISLGPMSLRLSFIVGLCITFVLIGLYQATFFNTLMNNLFGLKL